MLDGYTVILDAVAKMDMICAVQPRRNGFVPCAPLVRAHPWRHVLHLALNLITELVHRVRDLLGVAPPPRGYKVFFGQFPDAAAPAHAVAGAQIELVLALVAPPVEVDGALRDEGELL